MRRLSSECPGGAMTPQEKLLEFMIFDLGSCVSPSVPPVRRRPAPRWASTAVRPVTAAATYHGRLWDMLDRTELRRRGNARSGARRPARRRRGRAGYRVWSGWRRMRQLAHPGPARPDMRRWRQAGHLRRRSCMPTTFVAQGVECGPAGDGAGTRSAAALPTDQTCGGGGQAGVCGSSCVPVTCVGLGFNCGPAGDGCGNQLDCGTCSAPQTCGGGGTAGVCGGNIPK